MNLVLAITLDNPTLLGIAAVISAVGGIASTIAALRKSRSEDEQLCLERLKKAREEAETAAAELHERKMKEVRDDPMDQSNARG